VWGHAAFAAEPRCLQPGGLPACWLARLCSSAVLKQLSLRHHRLNQAVPPGQPSTRSRGADTTPYIT
jgi:hypothetical protein